MEWQMLCSLASRIIHDLACCQFEYGPVAATFRLLGLPNKLGLPFVGFAWIQWFNFARLNIRIELPRVCFQGRSGTQPCQRARQKFASEWIDLIELVGR